MHIGGNARFMTDVHSAAEVQTTLRNALQHGLKYYILGGGSNVLVPDEGFDGIVIRNRILGFEIISEEPGAVTIRVGAGESWDATVARTVEKHLSGIECLSGIPGSVGAAPVQNIGAYGQEISSTLVSLDAYSIPDDRIVSLSNEDCNFSYRDSMFKQEGRGRYVILSVTLRLYRDAPQPPFYKQVQEYLDSANITAYTPEILRQTVLAIRTDKLPDPAQHPNSGSFFKNAIVEEWQLNDIRTTYPDVPSYNMPDGKVKIPTGWLIEQTGLKNQVLHGVRVHDKNALVLINESATSYADIAAARDEIIGAVRDKFRIMIEQEPLEMRV